MNKTREKRIYIIVLGALFILFSGCRIQWQSLGEGGSLYIQIESESTSRSILPDNDMIPVDFKVRGEGPDGEVFEKPTDSGKLNVYGLGGGTWMISVIAYNIDGEEVAYGEETATVVTLLETDVYIETFPLEGEGTLSLAVSWPEEEITNPEVQIRLTDTEGNTLEPEVTTEENLASGNLVLPSGYYTMSITLLDEGIVLAGLVEAVRIVQNSTTEGDFSFASINHPTGDLSITVSISDSTPLTVEITGGEDVLVYGAEMSLSAAAANGEGNTINYKWYLNGTLAGESETKTLGSDLRRGYYRLDCVAVSEDGYRAGSAGYTFTVE